MIGNVPDGWRVEKLGNITDIVRNGINVEQFDNGLIPISRIETISYEKVDFRRVKYVNEISDENLQKYLIHYGDILFSHINSPIHIGKTAIYKDTKQIIHGANLLLIRVKNENPDFINYFLKEIKKHKYFYSRCNKSVNQASIKQSEILKIPIPIPPLPQQEKIVKVLDISSGLIEKQKELIENYDLFLKSKFIEMFGSIKNNPYGFDIEPLSKFGKIITGNTPPRKEPENYDDNFIEWIKTDNISPNELYISQAKEYLSKVGMSKGRVLEKNGLLITCIAGSIKSIANVAMTDRKITFNQQINAIQPNKDINPLYLYWLIKLNKNYILTFATSSMKKMITKGVFQEIPFIKPPLNLQNKFSEIALKVDTIKAKETQKLEHLETLHSSLMDKAFQGEII